MKAISAEELSKTFSVGTVVVAMTANAFDEARLEIK